MGKAFFGITAVFAEMERELIAERTKMILDGKRENGEVIGTVPYGYKRDGDKLIKSFREQRVIARMRSLRSLGLSFIKISKALAAEKIQNRKGTLFPPDHIRLIVSREPV